MPAAKPTDRSIAKIELGLNMEIPSEFVHLAEQCSSYGGWFASPGDDYDNPSHILSLIEVSSRLWIGSRLGRRSYRNTTAVLNEVLVRGRLVGFPLIATDGFEYCFEVIAPRGI